MKTWVKQLAPSILVCMMAAHANAASFNTELLINGGAEAGDTSGWLTTGIDAVSSALALSLASPLSVGCVAAAAVNLSLNPDKTHSI